MSHRIRYVVLLVVAAASLLPSVAYANLSGPSLSAGANSIESGVEAMPSAGRLRSSGAGQFNRSTRWAALSRPQPTGFEPPATLEIHTVPALEGIQFALDGRAFETDE